MAILLRLLVVAVIFCISIEQTRAEVIEVNLLTSEYPPYQSNKLKNKGALSELIVAAFAVSGIKANITLAPWDKALEQAKLGTYDGLFPAWKTKERESYFIYSKAFVPNEMGFYKQKDNDIRFTRFADLKRHTIGIVKGYAYPEAFFNAQLKTINVTKDEQNMALLCRGLIDLALTDKTVGMYIVQTRYSECAKKIQWLEPSINIETNHLVISRKVKDHRLIISAFNRGLMTLQQKDGIRKILEKHGLYQALIH